MPLPPSDKAAPSDGAAWLHKRWALPALIGALAAAALVLALRRPRASDMPTPFHVKGLGGVRVSYLQGGKTHLWESGRELTAGTRLKVEVLASTPTTAFQGITNHDGRLVSDIGSIWRSRLTVGNGAEAAFAENLQLTGASEGETLAVLACPDEAVAGATEATLGAGVAEALAGPGAPTGALADCRIERFRLHK